MARTRALSLPNSLLLGLSCGLIVVAAASTVRAQDGSSTGPTVPRPETTIPEKIEPAPPPKPGQPIPPGLSLSEKLDRTDGVLVPPPVGTPLKQVEPPVPHPNTTPVIPPPGTPANPSPVEPK